MKATERAYIEFTSKTETDYLGKFSAARNVLSLMDETGESTHKIDIMSKKISEEFPVDLSIAIAFLNMKGRYIIRQPNHKTIILDHDKGEGERLMRDLRYFMQKVSDEVMKHSRNYDFETAFTPKNDHEQRKY